MNKNNISKNHIDTKLFLKAFIKKKLNKQNEKS
jgi:hypothetical protein